MLDYLMVGGAIVAGLGMIAKLIIAWKELDKEEDQEEEDHK